MCNSAENDELYCIVACVYTYVCRTWAQLCPVCTDSKSNFPLCIFKSTNVLNSNVEYST